MFSCPCYQLIALTRKPSYGCAGISSGDSREDRAGVKQALVSAYKSNLSHKVKAELRDSGNDFYIASKYKKSGGWSTTWWQQFSVLLRRGVKERRQESFSAIRVGRILFVAFLVGLLWWQSSPDNIGDRVLSHIFFPLSVLNA
jgi:ATP-binding cassette subfamily G (WHITE) protein 2